MGQVRYIRDAKNSVEDEKQPSLEAAVDTTATLDVDHMMQIAALIKTAITHVEP